MREGRPCTNGIDTIAARTTLTDRTLGGTDMTSFRDSAATRLLVVTTSNANPYWPTGCAVGAVKSATTRFDVGDTITAAAATPPNTPPAAVSIFQIDSTRMAVIHRIYVASGTATSTVKLVAYASAGLEDLTPTYSAATTGTLYDFTPGIIVPGGFGVVMGTANSTVHVIYSLLES